MKRKTFTNSLLLCFFIACIALVADLNGKWSGLLKMSDGNEIALTYNFKVDGAKLTGSAASPEGEVQIDSGKYVGPDFSFSVNVNGMDIPHKGHFYGDSVGMDITISGNVSHVTLKRAN